MNATLALMMQYGKMDADLARIRNDLYYISDEQGLRGERLSIARRVMSGIREDEELPGPGDKYFSPDVHTEDGNAFLRRTVAHHRHARTGFRYCGCRHDIYTTSSNDELESVLRRMERAK